VTENSSEPSAVSAEVSDEEVAALLDRQSAKVQDAAVPRVRPYHFVDPGTIPRGKMPSLDAVNERWVAPFHQGLNALVGQQLDLARGEVELLAFLDWSASFRAPACLNLYSLKPGRGNVLVAMEFELVSMLVDIYYGGAGKISSAQPTRLTRTEARLNRMVLDILTACMVVGFEDIAQVGFDYQKTETDLDLVSVATPGETDAVTTIEMSYQGSGGKMSLVVPQTALEPFRDKLSEQLALPAPPAAELWERALTQHLQGADVELVSIFLQTHITLGNLMQFEAGDIVPIEMPRMATLYADGRALIRGKFGVSRGYNAVRVVEPAGAKGVREVVPI
jgi:flagellar motor switch protein FliM